jgi:hypothetical protein
MEVGHLMSNTHAGVSGPTDWNEALDIISFGSPEQVSKLSFILIELWLTSLNIHFLFKMVKSGEVSF